jgi:hypothetical protein
VARQTETLAHVIDDIRRRTHKEATDVGVHDPAP